MKLDGDLVKDVSRSFYLTLRLLPSDIREVISLGYLIARASDTIADTAGADLGARQKALSLYEQSILDRCYDPELEVLVGALFSEQKHEGERVLMAQLGGVIASLERFTTAELALLEKVSVTIIKGQRWDLDYFQAKGQLIQVAEASELEEYTYLVAGCVGEFWTEVLALHGYIRAEDHEQMLDWGIHYGKGLQLTNIVRDIPEDYENGRIYIPSDTNDLPAVIAASDEWVERAKSYLEEGRLYAKKIQSRRLRGATVLPARLGVKTLDLIQQTDQQVRAQQKVKVERAVVLREMMKSLLFS